MDEFQRELSAAQWREWCAFFDLEPTGGQHEDLRWGMLLSLIANVNRGKKSDPVSRPGDWFPTLGPARKERGQSEAEQVRRWESLAAATKGARVR